MPNMTAKKREMMNAAMRERVFECSVELLRSAGWRKFTMDKLAQSVGVSKGTLYNYFVDKRDVIRFIRTCIVEDLCTELERGLDSAEDPREFLGRVIDVTLERMGKYRFISMAFFDMAMSLDKESFISCAGDFLQEHMLASVLARCMDADVVRRGDPMLMAIALNSSMAAMELSCNLLYGYDFSKPEVRTQITDWLLNGVLTEGMQKSVPCAKPPTPVPMPESVPERVAQ